MPDTSHQRELVDEFERYAAATGGKMGGVFLARNKKSCIVNIRPKRWSDKHKRSKFWKGKIRNLELAKYIADAFYHYCGKPRFHFGNAPLTFPPLSCMGANAGTTAEQRSKYVESIAGEAFHCERKAFFQQVLDVIESEESILQRERFLLNLRNVQVAPHPLPLIDEAAADNPSPVDEAAAVNPSPTDNPSPRGEAAAAAPSSATDEVAADFPSPTGEAGRDEECEAPLEEDLEAIAMVSGFAPSSQGATFASFGLNVEKFGADSPGRILESVEQRLECYSLNDCSPGEAWNMALEDLNKKSAMAAPNGPIPQPVFEITFFPGTNFVVSPDISEERQLAITPHG